MRGREGVRRDGGTALLKGGAQADASLLAAAAVERHAAQRVPILQALAPACCRRCAGGPHLPGGISAGPSSLDSATEGSASCVASAAASLSCYVIVWLVGGWLVGWWMSWLVSSFEQLAQLGLCSTPAAQHNPSGAGRACSLGGNSAPISALERRRKKPSVAAQPARRSP